MAFTRWMYSGGRPNWLAKGMNRMAAWQYALGIIPNYLVTLEVVGRKSGKVISFPLVMVVIDGERYLVSMLGADANWVRNLAAAEGRARLRHGASEEVRLVEVEIDQRAPILKKYLQRAPGARPHISVSKDAPLAEFAKVAAQYPVYRVETVQ